MTRLIIRCGETKEYIGSLSSDPSLANLFSNIDELRDPYGVHFAKEVPLKSGRNPKWMMFDWSAPYTGTNAPIIECK